MLAPGGEFAFVLIAAAVAAGRDGAPVVAAPLAPGGASGAASRYHQ